MDTITKVICGSLMCEFIYDKDEPFCPRCGSRNPLMRITPATVPGAIGSVTPFTVVADSSAPTFESYRLDVERELLRVLRANMSQGIETVVTCGGREQMRVKPNGTLVWPDGTETRYG